MRIINIELGKSGYEIASGAGLLAEAPHLLGKAGVAGRLVIIADPTVRRLHGERLKASLSAAGFTASLLESPEGEEQKSLENAGVLYEKLTALSADRATTILAVGGGVIGDLAGFVAATYMRGIPLVQVPTTLLAQVDSSIGGKVAVNHGRLKNRIGAFYQPRLVLADTSVLKTLPEIELNNGLAEVIKYGVIQDSAFFTFIEENLEKIKNTDGEVLEATVATSAHIKAEIVAQDERDTGLRNILNFGHTVGHAVETVTDFTMPHGQAVAIGMVAEARISCLLGMLPQNEAARLRKLLVRAGLPVEVPHLSLEKLLNAMRYDKKNINERIRFILPRAIGEVYITDDVGLDTITDALAE